MDKPPVMTSFVKLLCRDLPASLAFYEKLGFEVSAQDAVFARLKWATDAYLYLVRTPSVVTLEGKRGLGVLVCFTAVSPSVDEVAARAQAAGVAVDGPINQMWHTREAVVTDPDGYRINFVQPV